LNALDNVDARRHVNRLCLAANVPLFDSGTTGYLGQVMPILKGYTSCYECFPKPSPKVYAICTIRSTPDKPVHCIVWAKECFKLLFGNTAESMLFEDESTGEKSEYMHLMKFPVIPVAVSEEGNQLDTVTRSTLTTYLEELVIGLFHNEVQKKIDMEVYKTAKSVPIPLNIDLIRSTIHQAMDLFVTPRSAGTVGIAGLPSSGANWEQKVWTVAENIMEFVAAIYELLISKDVSFIGQLSFDKDDLWAMKFVTACTNIRSSIFSIPCLSFHDAKGVAGNIIPAIATTNAIVAGIQVSQAMKFITSFTKEQIFTALVDDAKKEEIHQKLLELFPHNYCLRHPTRKGCYLQPSKADLPVETCFVCGKSELTLQIDIHETTLQELLTKIIKGKLGFNEPTLTTGSNILYEEGEDCDEDLQENLPLKLSACPAGGIQDGTMMSISDFTQNLEVNLLVKHYSNEEFGKLDPLTSVAAVDLFILEGQQQHEQRQAAEKLKSEEKDNNNHNNNNSSSSSSANANTATNTTNTGNVIEEEDVMIIMDEEEVIQEKKEKMNQEQLKQKQSSSKDDNVVCIDDDDENEEPAVKRARKQ